MSSRKTIYLTDEAEAALQPLDEGDSLSGRINTTLVRYAKIWPATCPALTVNEWCAIVDANNGTVLDAAGDDPARHAWMNVVDSEELDEKWDINRLDLGRSMKSMSYVEQCAVIEITRLFWMTKAKEDETHREIFARIGARLSD